MSATPSTFEELEALCQRICHVLERENAILRSRNGLIGEGIEELEGIQAEKDSSIALLERASRDDLCIAESRRSPERAERVRMAIGRCKDLQMRNHQIFPAWFRPSARSSLFSASRRTTSISTIVQAEAVITVSRIGASWPDSASYLAIRLATFHPVNPREDDRHRAVDILRDFCTHR